MQLITAALTDPARRNRPLALVIDPDGRTMDTRTYGEVHDARDRLADHLSEQLPPGASVGLVAADTPEWIEADLALLAAGLVEVPVPLSFTAEQAGSLLSGTSLCLVDERGAARLREWGLARCRDLVPLGDVPARRPPRRAPRQAEIVKVIHTSGTTSAPKGVRIRASGLAAVLQGLAAVLPPGSFDRYVSLAPFSLLVEQVAGIYTPLLAGGSVVLPPPDAPLPGSPGTGADDSLAWLRMARASAANLSPSLVSALDRAVADMTAPEMESLFGRPRPPLLTAGGGPVDVDALRRLATVGIEVLQGYGLSEASSVVTLNLPGDNVFGTVGRPLPHVRARVDPDGELLVRSAATFAGYTVEDPTSCRIDGDGWLHTGDRAVITEAGHVRIVERIKDMAITAHGRNLSPAWVEAQLEACPPVRRAAVFADGLEHPVAVVVADDAVPAAVVRAQVIELARASLAETDRPTEVVVLADTPDVRQRYVPVSDRMARTLLLNEIVRPLLDARQPGSRHATNPSPAH